MLGLLAALDLVFVVVFGTMGNLDPLGLVGISQFDAKSSFATNAGIVPIGDSPNALRRGHIASQGVHGAVGSNIKPQFHAGNDVFKTGYHWALHIDRQVPTRQDVCPDFHPFCSVVACVEAEKRCANGFRSVLEIGWIGDELHGMNGNAGSMRRIEFVAAQLQLPPQQESLDDPHKGQRSSEDYDPHRFVSDSFVLRPVPEGFARQTLYLFGWICFCGLLTGGLLFYWNRK